MPYQNTGWNGTRYDREAAAARRQQTASGLTGDFAKQAEANPYVGREFSPTFWQDLGERWFNDYSARDRFYAEQDQSADEYLSQLLDAQRQQEYNSPSAQAARERAAGLNPDVTGVGTGEQPAVGANPDDTPPGMGSTDSDTLNTLSAAGSLTATLIGLPMDGVQTFMGIMASAQELGIKQSQKEWMEVNNYLNAFPGMVDYLAGTETTADVPERFTALSGGSDYYKTLSPSGVQAMRHSRLSKGAQQILRDMRGQIMYDKNGKPTKAFDRAITGLEKGNLADKQSIVAIKNSIGYDDDFLRWTDQNYASFAKFENAALEAEQRLRIRLADVGLRMNSDGVISLAIGAKNAQNRAGIQQGTYEAEYYSSMDGTAAGEEAVADVNSRKANHILEQYFTNMRAAEEDLYRKNLKWIDTNMKGGAKFAARIAEHKRHEQYLKNLTQSSQSLTNQIIDLAATGATNNVVNEFTK